MRNFTIVIEMVVGIAALLAAVAAVFYGALWVTLIAMRFLPMVGKRHRHDRWEQMNQSLSRRSD